MSSIDTDNLLGGLADAVGGSIGDVMVLPDGSGSATMSFPLPEDHWLYQLNERGYVGEPSPTMLLGYRHENGGRKAARDYFEDLLIPAIRYGVRASTRGGRDNDFDPDALVRNVLIGLMGYYTTDGHSQIEGERGGEFDVQQPQPFKKQLLELLQLAMIDGVIDGEDVAVACNYTAISEAKIRLHERREAERLEAEERDRQAGLERERRRSIAAELWTGDPVNSSTDPTVTLGRYHGVEIYEFTFEEGPKRLGAVMTYEQQEALRRVGVAVHKLDSITPVGQDFCEGSCTLDFGCCRHS